MSNEPDRTVTHPETGEVFTLRAPSAMELLEALWTLDPDGGWHLHGPPGPFLVHDAREGTPDHVGASVALALTSALASVRASLG